MHIIDLIIHIDACFIVFLFVCFLLLNLPVKCQASLWWRMPDFFNHWVCLISKMHRTKFCPTCFCFSSDNFLSWIYSTMWKKRSVTNFVSSSAEASIFLSVLGKPRWSWRGNRKRKSARKERRRRGDCRWPQLYKSHYFFCVFPSRSPLSRV